MTLTKASSEGTIQVVLTTTKDAPIGRYNLNVFVRKNGVEYIESAELAILFNPYLSDDDVYQSKSNREEYVENTEGLIWQGLSDSNTAHKWTFDQFNWKNLDVSLDMVRRMPVADRADPALVARHLTYAVR